MKKPLLFYGGLVLGVLICTVGVYLATTVHYHERAAFVLAGGLCCLGMSFLGKYLRPLQSADGLRVLPAFSLDALLVGVLITVAGGLLAWISPHPSKAFAFLLVGVGGLTAGVLGRLALPIVAHRLRGRKASGHTAGAGAMTSGERPS